MISICVIGSRARGTADTYSDKDVLLVGASSNLLEQTITRWKLRGWNAAVFDPGAFSRLADVRSLFVQHVKQDGRMIRDDDFRLSNTLKRFNPKTDYSGERNDSLRQIATLPMPNGNYWHDLCLADIIYVLFRNAAILHYASTGQYCFEYQHLVHLFGDQGYLSNKAREALLNLRELKYAYRGRYVVPDPAPCVRHVRDVISSLGTQVSSVDTSAVRDGVTTDDYLMLRLEELALAWRITPPILDCLPPDHALFNRWKNIVGAARYPKDRPRS